jgi:hypothetical protein
MGLLELPCDLLGAWLVPLLHMADVVRLTACCKESSVAVSDLLRSARLQKVRGGPDIEACLLWANKRNIRFGELEIDYSHYHQLVNAQSINFPGNYKNIALIFDKHSMDDTKHSLDRDMKTMIAERIQTLSAYGGADVSAEWRSVETALWNLRALSYTVKDFHGCDEQRLIKLILNNTLLAKVAVNASLGNGAEFFKALLTRRGTLVDLSLSACRPSLVHCYLACIGTTCPALRRLTLESYQEEEQGDGLVDLAEGCQQLEELTLTNVDVSEGSFTVLIQRCPRLCVLRVWEGFLRDANLLQLHRHGVPMRDLEPFWMVDSTQTVDACASTLASVVAFRITYSSRWHTAVYALSHMTRLHSLCLHGREADILPHVALHCPHIKVLRLTRDDKDKYTPAIAAALIAVLPSLRNLEELHWMATSRFGDSGLYAVAEHCPRLRALTCRCVYVTDVGLTAVLQRCASLRVLTFSCSPKDRVSNAFLRAVAMYGTNLQELRLPSKEDARRFDLGVVAAMVQACKYLRVLRVSDSLLSNLQAKLEGVRQGRLRRLRIESPW